MNADIHSAPTEDHELIVSKPFSEFIWDEEEFNGNKSEYLARNLDDILPKYIVNQLLETGFAEEQHSSLSPIDSTADEHLKMRSKDEHLLSLIDFHHDMTTSEADFMKRFDIEDFLQDDDWQLDYDKIAPILHKKGKWAHFSYFPLSKTRYMRFDNFYALDKSSTFDFKLFHKSFKI